MDYGALTAYVKGIKPRATDSAALVVGVFFGFVVAVIGRSWFEARKRKLPKYLALSDEMARSVAAVRGTALRHPQSQTVLPLNLPQAVQVHKHASQLGYAGCLKCNRLLQPMESHLCADCRKPAVHSSEYHDQFAPGIAEHVAQSNIANIERSNRTGPSEANAAPISASLSNHFSLLAAVRGLEGTVIITMQQYEGGPWWSRAFLAKDVATAYLKLGLPVPPSGDEASLLAEAVKHDSEIADCLVDAQISSLVEAVADNAQESIDLVAACL